MILPTLSKLFNIYLLKSYFFFMQSTKNTMMVAGVTARSMDKNEVHNAILMNCPFLINLSLVTVSLYPKSRYVVVVCFT